MLFEQCFDLHVIESVSGQSIGVLNKNRSDGFVVLDPKKHILESWPVHIRSRSSWVFEDAVIGQLELITFLNGSLAELELGRKGMVAILGLFLGRDSAVNQCMFHSIFILILVKF